MNRTFVISQSLVVPDGTIVFPFLNPKDITSDLPWHLIEGFSLSAGEIPAHGESKIHVMPHVTHVAFVLQGYVEIRMKDAIERDVYTLRLQEHQAALTEPKAFLQYINPTSVPCRLLYIVSPAYLFEMDQSGKVIYDDSIIIEWAWDELKTRWNWSPPELNDPAFSVAARQASYERLGKLKSGATHPVVS